jgi:uncharacterized membrane protein
MPTWAYDILYPVSGWLHAVCTTLIVGGTLFFELVLPIAIDELKREQQLFVLARARLVFRWVVWISVAGLLLSGGLSLYRMRASFASGGLSIDGWWALAHVGLGVLGMIIALLLTVGGRPPENPVGWMRLNLVILLVAIFLGGAIRHFQLPLGDRPRTWRIPEYPPERDGSAPAMQPATQASSQQP